MDVTIINVTVSYFLILLKIVVVIAVNIDFIL